MELDRPKTCRHACSQRCPRSACGTALIPVWQSRLSGPVGLSTSSPTCRAFFVARRESGISIQHSAVAGWLHVQEAVPIRLQCSQGRSCVALPPPCFQQNDV